MVPPSASCESRGLGKGKKVEVKGGGGGEMLNLRKCTMLGNAWGNGIRGAMAGMAVKNGFSKTIKCSAEILIEIMLMYC